MAFREVRAGETVDLGGSRIPANHTVPAVGYILDSGQAALAYSGDTAPNDGLWDAVNAAENLRDLIIETAFSDGERDISRACRYRWPGTLASELEKMRASREVFITHLKPGEGAHTMQEISEAARRRRPRMLENHQEFTI
jgi:ribonuclease BN (tRNA processing enzyme)